MPKWTEDQEKAIYHRGHDILVSAAAGSGKTTILIERIVEMLKDGENVDNLLVATFTDAAALEMKERLLKRIKELVNDRTLDAETHKHLQKQIFRIPIANISTLHAFCLSIIKKFYYVIDLDPNFLLLSDTTEQSIMKEQAYDNLRNKYYDKDDADFIKLTDNFTDDRSDDGLKDVIFKLYDFAITNAETQQWLDDLITNYQFDDSFSDSNFYKKDVVPQLKQRLEQLREVANQGIDLADTDELTAKSLFATFKTAQEDLGKLEDEVGAKSYSDIRTELLGFNLKKATSLKKDDKEGNDLSTWEKAKKVRDKLKRQVDQLFNDFFLQSESGVQESLIQSQSIIAKLVEVERGFIKEYGHLKNNSHVLDFNDLEHMAVKILQSPVDDHMVALDYYQTKFHELMIDEYQDVNAMQEKIIQLLSNENNHLFMVGDIKQSIYGFRQAAPYIFAQKYEDFQSDANTSELIQLSKNFRSAKSVDDFVNRIFKRIFDKKIGDIDYDDKSKLIPGTNFPDSVDSENEFNLLVNNDDEDVEKRQTLIENAAKRIQALIKDQYQIYDGKKDQMRTIRYSDIAILSRTKENNTDLISYFAKADIPIMVTDAQNYFQTTELQIMMSMLNIIDNPYQDIPLVAVLRSPIVGLNEEELAEIRLVDKQEFYFTALSEYLRSEIAKDEIKNKVQAFLLQLENYRDFANKNSIARLIWKIYQETGLLEYVSGMSGGKQRAANLHALYQRASAYEETNYKGLHQFINFIQRMQDLDKDLSQPNSIEATDDTVKVMTVHASKGLEFPIVIYLDMAKQFNKRDFQGQTVFDTDQGIGITLVNNQTRLRYRTLQHSVISNLRKVATTSEEMRLLYVALTRAKQKLIMFGFTKDVEDTINTWDEVSPKTGVINEALRLKANNFQDLVGISTLSDNDREDVSEELYTNKTCNLVLKLIYPEVKDDVASKIIIPKKAPVEPSDLFKKTVKQLLDFNYRYQESVDTTAYQSVSEIKGLFADPDEDGMAEDLLEDKSRYNLGSFAKPQFLTKTKKVTAAEVGSATHLVLQKINLDKTPTIADFQELIQQMVNEKLLTDELAEKIDCQSLADFYQSNLGQTIVEHHQTVSREFPCSILMPAQKLFKNSSKDYSVNDKILVHGIIDGVIELDHGIIIFDYKTDRVTDQNFEELVSKYSGQVNLYAEAISVIKNKPVVGKYLYFLKVNKAIDLQEK